MLKLPLCYVLHLLLNWNPIGKRGRTMKCPQCGLFHPSRYEQCVSCGTRLSADAAQSTAPSAIDMRKSRGLSGAPNAAPPRPASPVDVNDSEEEEEEEEEARDSQPRKRQPRQAGGPRGLPGWAVMVFCAIFLACAGGTYFFLTKPPEYEVLLTRRA
jgi:predicted RNA-binding Zn-ribbon protein involved in translation (DUF1610 family)